jgi:hypothetical protein
MKTKWVTVVIAGGFVLGVGLGGSAQAEPTDQGAASASQGRIATATLKLENEFDRQFVQGHIDRTTLAPLVDEAVQAMPEATRSKTRQHIEQVVAAGEKLATQMTPDERKRAATPGAEKVGQTEQAQIAAWGWPGAGAWGGLGAFGFPGMYYGYGGCTPGYGYVGPFGYSYSSSCAYGTYGGLGLGGWYW